MSNAIDKAMPRQSQVLRNGVIGKWIVESHFSINWLVGGFRMQLRKHLSITGEALRGWFIVQLYDALAVGVLWLIGLLVLHVPLAPLWALLAGMFQLIPVIGIIFGLIGPATAATVSGGITHMFYVLILYAIIAVIDGFVLQPILTKRSARVPIWASIITPLLMGSLLNVWGVLLSVPLLAIIYAYRDHYRRVM